MKGCACRGAGNYVGQASEEGMFRVKCFIAFRSQLGHFRYRPISIRVPIGDVQRKSITPNGEIGNMGRQAIALDLKGVQVFLGESQILRDHGMAGSKLRFRISYLGPRPIASIVGGRDRRS